VSKKSANDEIIEQILKLRVKAIAVLEFYEAIHSRIDFYRKYLSLSKTHQVRLADGLIVIQGGRSTEAARLRLKTTEAICVGAARFKLSLSHPEGSSSRLDAAPSATVGFTTNVDLHSSDEQHSYCATHLSRCFHKRVQRGGTMARYNVSFSCNECGRLHPTKLFLTLSKDFATGEKLSQVYSGEPLPSEVIKLFRHPALCPITKNSVIIDYSDRLHLVVSA
jgi:hypothetical protein